ncbi:AAA family ATPase [Streptomyces sp. NRRL S-1868]|uniref:AAA family ATPase n=1 Tax=Streptomyces sp. NRRL S-1868 TaxID=1463892 RepID=UPI0006899737|nr:AAA family ATPase [Streptomyces sp. NRRL S-1868]
MTGIHAPQPAGPARGRRGPRGHTAAPPHGREGCTAPARPAAVCELRLSAFRSLRARTVPLGPVTVLTGPSGSGKSTVLEAYRLLAGLACGATVAETVAATRGDVTALVPQQARADAQGRRGFRLGCTVTGPAGPVRFDVAVQAEPELRVVGERLADPEGTLLSTALRDPGRRAVEATWRTSGRCRVLRAPFPDDRLTTPLLPLRVAGTNEAQRGVVTAAEQLVVALRSAFSCDPAPEAMRAPAAAREGLLRSACDNLAAVLRRTGAECTARHAALLSALREGCTGPITQLRAESCGPGLVRAVLGRGAGRADTPLEWLGDGELRYAALSLVLLTGPGVLAVDPVTEVPAACRALMVLADGMDRDLDGRQARRLLALASRMSTRGRVRLLATGPADGPLVREATAAVAAVAPGAAAGESASGAGGEAPSDAEAGAARGTPGEADGADTGPSGTGPAGIAGVSLVDLSA